MTDPAEPVAAI